MKEKFMPRRCSTGRARILGLMLSLLVGCLAWPASAGLPAKPADLFQTTNVWNIHLQFTPEQWQAAAGCVSGGQAGRVVAVVPRAPADSGRQGWSRQPSWRVTKTATASCQKKNFMSWVSAGLPSGTKTNEGNWILTRCERE